MQPAGKIAVRRRATTWPFLFSWLAVHGVAAGCRETSAAAPSGDAPFASATELEPLPLGAFRVPIPAPPLASDHVRHWPDNGGPCPGDAAAIAVAWHLEFQLVAIVRAADRERAAALFDARRGRLHDEVIRQCRALPIDDLHDHSLAYARACVREAIENVAPMERIHSFLLSDVVITGP